MTTQTLQAPLPGTDWKDAKRHLWLLGAVLPLLPLVGWQLAQITGYGVFWWFAPIFFYTVIPLLDWLVGEDPSNPPESAVARLEADRYYRWLVYAYIPVQYAMLVWGAWAFTSLDLRWWELLGLAISIGGIGGVGINTAHELGHKKESLERWLAKITLAQVAYGHFFVEHNKGHHKNVATPEDPASSRLGENFYAFLPRTVIGSLKSAWRIEKARLARAGKSPWSWENENLQAWGMTVVLWGALLAVFGPALLPFLIIQAVYGFSLLEVVNYVEHYGLLRQKEAAGRYERCQPRHSWNSNHIVTNLLLYQLQRHSDHHANPTRAYQALRHFDESPQLPTGYAGMVLLAYFPPLWRRVMDKRVLAHYRGDLSRANIQPSRRTELLARYGQTTA
ncbi:MAG TPA: alkane 1-monooxygenase [Nevskiales bacterium]|nr:alkane 1-monooxygenase [Nevskiales bacterium]